MGQLSPKDKVVFPCKALHGEQLCFEMGESFPKTKAAFLYPPPYGPVSAGPAKSPWYSHPGGLFIPIGVFCDETASALAQPFIPGFLKVKRKNRVRSYF